MADVVRTKVSKLYSKIAVSLTWLSFFCPLPIRDEVENIYANKIILDYDNLANIYFAINALQNHSFAL